MLQVFGCDMKDLLCVLVFENRPVTQKLLILEQTTVTLVDTC